MKPIYLFYKQNYHKTTSIIFLIGIFIFFVSLIYFSLETDDAEYMFKEMVHATEQKGFDGSRSAFVVFLLILLNNLKLSLVMIILGFIPILVLPMFTPFATFFSLGLVLAVFESELSLGLEIFFFALFPHVFVEFLGFSLAAGVGFSLSITIIRKIFSKKRMQFFVFKEIQKSTKAFFFLVLPIILLGSIIECTLSPYLTKTFLPFD